jgi:hypothetical protein
MTDIELLEELLEQLPNPHHERAGIIRSIEVLRAYGTGSARSLVGYERRLHKMRYTELLAEAQRLGAQVFKDITRPELIGRILEVQGINDDILKGDPPA